MSAKARSTIGGIFTVVGSVIPGYGWVLMLVGAALSYSGARQAQKEAERRARAGGRLDSLRGNVRGSHEHHLIVAGKTRVGGIIAAGGNTDGPDMPKQNWHLGLEHSIAHPGGCEGLAPGFSFWIDETKLGDADVTGDPNTGLRTVTHADYNGFVFVRHYRGTSTQTQDLDLETANIDPPNAYRRGIAWSYLKFTRPNDDAAFSKAFKFGYPNITVELSGWRCYDPRKDDTNGGVGVHRYAAPSTWEWSDNPALFAATLEIVAETDGGCGKDPLSIIWSSVAAAANVCDELITTPSGTQKRFRIGGALSTSDKRDVNIQKSLDAMMGVRVPVGDKFAYHPAVYRAPTVDISRSWIAGPVSVRSRDPLESIYNFVRVNFNDAEQDYKTIEAPAYVNAAYEAQDGGRRITQDLSLPMVSNKWQAQYLSQIHGKRSRYQMTVEMVCNLRAMDVEAWETCTLNADLIPDIDLSARVFRIVHWEPEGDVIRLVLREDHSSIYTVEAFQTPAPSGTATAGEETPPAPTNVEAFARPDGIRVSWTSPALFLYRSIDILRSTNNVDFVQVGTVGRATSYFTDRITDGNTYYYKLRARALTAYSAFSASAGPVTAKLVGDGSGQLAFNLGFESGNTDWVVDGGLYWAIVQDANAQTGAWCAKFTSIGSAQTGIIRNSESRSVAPGDAVLAFGNIKSSAGADGTAYWRISWLNSAGVEIGTAAGNAVTPTTSYVQSRVTGIAPAGTALCRIEVVGSNISTGQWYADNGYITVTPKSLDDVPDGTTYGRPRQAALTAGDVDLSKVGVINRTADNLAESATRKWAAESGAQVVTGKSIDILADGATYQRVKATALSAGEVDLTKAGVLNKSADNIAEAPTRKWAAESGADVTSGKSVNVLVDVKTVAQFFTFTQTVTATGAGSVTIPTGARTCVIRAWGGGGGGARFSPQSGAGGGAGGAKKTVVLRFDDWGGTISYNVGAKGIGRTATNGAGTAGAATTVISSGLSFPNLNVSANGGGAGTTVAGGAGGTATGGDTNVSGAAGEFSAVAVGGTSAAIDSISGRGGIPDNVPIGEHGHQPGGGGCGEVGENAGNGGDGMVSFTWEG